MRVFALACLLLAGIVACEEMLDLHGTYVFSVKSVKKADVDFLHSLIETQKLMVFREPSVMRSADIAVPKEKIELVKHTLKRAGLAFTVQDTDLHDQATAERRENLISKMTSSLRRSPLPDHRRFYDLAEVNMYLHNLRNQYRHLCELKTMRRKTYEGNTVYYMELGGNIRDTRKPVIMIEGLTHAREWTGGAAVLYAIHKLLSDYNYDYEINEAMNKYTWVIVPVVNPDGFEFTHLNSSTRYWRKNRRYINSACTGVDLNRNYDVEWNTTGVSGSCQSDIYPGPRAFSEVETQNVRDLFKSLQERVVAFLSVHAYSQLLLHPWGFVDSPNTDREPRNVYELKRVGEKMTQALPNYVFGTAFEVLGYGASGASEDWALSQGQHIYSYTYELRPSWSAQNGFILPINQIIPTGKEFLKSLLVLSENIRQDSAIIFG